MEAKKDKTATVTISHKMTNDMMLIVDENGNTHTPEPKVSKPDTLTVKAGDKLGTFVVKKVSKSDITIYSEHFNYFMTPGNVKGQTFTIKRGQTASLVMMDLMDATSTTYIEVMP